MTPSDEELLQRTLRGDEGAFTALYRLRQAAVYRFALHMSGSAAIAEDVTQETFLELLTGGRKFDAARGTLRAFLFGVARNFVMRRIGRSRDEPLEESADGSDLLGDLTRRETIEQVRCAVLSLPPAYREVVVLCDLGDGSYEEAAAALECPVGTVRSRLSRARAMLASKLSGVRGTCHV
jgi:RNA polymerase sigma-70 factor (ECF subfamily)